jgi:3-isopropylmalate/(R)-2-methylmalate dehydratase small subunit
MPAFQAIQTTFVPMPEANIDTDQIIPARFLQKPRRDGCGPWLFHDLRENPAFVLNQPVYRDARALVAAENFGCGSSRENAVWALYDYGFRVVIAPGFGDIFYNNCLQNGLLPIRLPGVNVEKLLAASPAQTIAVDLASQTVRFGEEEWNFDVNAFAKHCLLNGIDELGYTLSRLDEIIAFERNHIEITKVYNDR